MLGYLIVAVFIAGVAAYAFYPPFRSKVDGVKTIATAALVAALGVLQQADLTSVVDAKTAGLWLIGIGIVMAVLRVITNGPPAGLR
jgi:hypothetical protein